MCANCFFPRDGWKNGETTDRSKKRPEPKWDEPETVLRLWRRRKPIVGTIVDTYLREGRGYSGPIPATLGFLPASGEYAPAMIAAFGMTEEPEPRTLRINQNAMMAIHLTHLAPDGLSRTGKMTVGRGALGTAIVVAPANDGLRLAVTEGIEDALSVYAATGLGAWAAGSVGRMPALADSVPNYVECVTVIGDDNDAGRKGAGELAMRLKARGNVEVVLKIIRGRP